MKKNCRLGRFLVLALTLVMVVSMMSIAVSATRYQSNGIYDVTDLNKSYNDIDGFLSFSSKEFPDDVAGAVDINDYGKYVQPYLEWGDPTLFEFVGMGSWDSDAKVANDVTHIDIPAFPENGTDKEIMDWYTNYSFVIRAYVLHEHDLSAAPWCYDNNYHWKNCSKCNHRVFLEWHTDKNEDGKCDLCGNDIKYYTVTVKDCEGGKITVSKDKGAMNDVVNVTVTPDAGYHLGQLHAYNNNEKHSELTRYEDVKGEAYHYVVLNWDIEVEATFVKD